MPKYHVRLWDEYSKVVLANTRDLDAREPLYAKNVAAKVWAAVDELRTQRRAFLKIVNAELRREKERKNRRSKPRV